MTLRTLQRFMRARISFIETYVLTDYKKWIRNLLFLIHTLGILISATTIIGEALNQRERSLAFRIASAVFQISCTLLMQITTEKLVRLKEAYSIFSDACVSGTIYLADVTSVLQLASDRVVFNCTCTNFSKSKHMLMNEIDFEEELERWTANVTANLDKKFRRKWDAIVGRRSQVERNTNTLPVVAEEEDGSPNFNADVRVTSLSRVVNANKLVSQSLPHNIGMTTSCQSTSTIPPPPPPPPPAF